MFIDLGVPWQPEKKNRVFGKQGYTHVHTEKEREMEVMAI